MRLVNKDDKILRIKAHSVEKINEEIKELMHKMLDFMLEETNGIGLAAPQIGISKRIVVIDTRSILYIPQKERNTFFIINPIIKSKYGKLGTYNEGCLSIPNIKVPVSRPKGVICHYYNLENKKQIINTESFLSRIIQHELDHLNGILMTDYLISENSNNKQPNI